MLQGREHVCSRFSLSPSVFISLLSTYYVPDTGALATRTKAVTCPRCGSCPRTSYWSGFPHRYTAPGMPQVLHDL